MLPPFWTLVETHGDELLVHARKLAGDRHAEDVVQEALLRALRAYPRLQHGDHLRAWLYRITTTTAYDVFRAKRPEVPIDDVVLPATDDRAFADDGFEALIKPLSENNQAALRARFVDDLDFDGVAVALSISPAAARQRVSTAVRELRKRMNP
jgi:RNA polymerase sigma-70 factor (ECF subfamily)